MLEYFEQQIKTSKPYTEEMLQERLKENKNSVLDVKVGDVVLFYVLRKKEPLPYGTVSINSTLLRYVNDNLSELDNRAVEFESMGVNDGIPIFREI